MVAAWWMLDVLQDRTKGMAPIFERALCPSLGRDLGAVHRGRHLLVTHNGLLTKVVHGARVPHVDLKEEAETRGW